MQISKYQQKSQIHPYPCPRCGQLVSHETDVCFNCSGDRAKNNALVAKKLKEGGTPFYLIALAIVIAILLYLVLAA